METERSSSGEGKSRRPTSVGPRIYTTGPVLDGEPPFWQSSIATETPAEAELAVAEQKKAGDDGVKVLGNISTKGYEAVLAAAARHEIPEIPVYDHAPTRLAWRTR